MDATANRSYLAIFLVGAAAGWLCGLSLSPIASVVVASIVGLGGAAITALSGLDPIAPKEKTEASRPRIVVTLVPIAVFAVALAIFATVGIVVREAGWLGFQRPHQPSAEETFAAKNALMKKEYDAWIAIGADPKEVLQAMLFASYGAGASAENTKSGEGTEGDKATGTHIGLYGVTAEQCDLIEGASPSTIKSLMMSAPGQILDQIANTPISANDLLVIGRRLCGRP